ncbi:hypothetical protein GLAREA_02605 [Glarea lozoyensis ATCC 20868]|uniref:PLD phosphodiesterase domain-containing protein n=1 Tax=Glarea lozoyensis (strain ATCC 20868 / MF5171) TaxID=1116229 RepID=S3CJJ6_GLAL2|nr:uncharacterized protein GLAREA_02605 [Glarea lozoyensis ATCC 20868]EPE26692.1 hypothetical protein GLAREA_02605 [Glarea lozoyensis ATCC 20868]
MAKLTPLRRLPLPTSPSLRTPHHRSSSTKTKPQSRLPAAYYRGGTSRAVIFDAKDLPQDRSQWPDIFRGVIGSPDRYGRQLDGLGGGISSLSKVCVVGSAQPGDRKIIDEDGKQKETAEADVDYTFAAIGVVDGDVDFSSNCGNMSAAIGPYAYDHGLVPHIGNGHGEATVRIRNTNSGKVIHSKFPVVDGEAASSGSFSIDGVEGQGARVRLDFLDPAGSKTGKLLPTGNVVDIFNGTEVTCIDVGNPCVFLKAESFGVKGIILPDDIDSHPTLKEKLESIRRQASAAMGLSKDPASTPGSIPKIAMVSKPSTHVLLSGSQSDEKDVDLIVRAMSVGQPHRAVPITVALALAAAANVTGSTVHDVASRQRIDTEGITVGHPTGKIVVGAEFDVAAGLKHATVYRTARRIMEGFVYWK